MLPIPKIISVPSVRDQPCKASKELLKGKREASIVPAYSWLKVMSTNRLTTPKI